MRRLTRARCDIRATRTDPGSDPGADGAADAALVRALHDAHAAALYGFCLNFTGDPQHAQDVVQEVLIRAWRHAATLSQDPRPVRPWLFATARNLLTDQYRAERSRPRLVAADTVLEQAPGEDDIGRAVEAWTMTEALHRLSPEHREILVHTHWMGRSVGETARALEIPAGTVKSRTYYALRALRLVLQEMGLTPWPS